jgi:hypothetical protein
MAHFAELDKNNIVKQVVVVDNNELLDENGNESEQKGIDFLIDVLGGVWKQTSYNGNIRKNYAGIGYVYDPIRDAFYPKQPFDNWILNEDSCRWEPPVPCPTDGKKYYWDQLTNNWVEIE